MNRRARLPMLKQIDRIHRSLPRVACKGLCVSSCGPIVLTELERDRIENRIGGKVPQRDDLTCGLLKDGRCSVYDIRPTICRFFGAVEGVTSELVENADILGCPHGCEVTPRKISKNESYVIMREVHAFGGGAVTFNDNDAALFERLKGVSNGR